MARASVILTCLPRFGAPPTSTLSPQPPPLTSLLVRSCNRHIFPFGAFSFALALALWSGAACAFGGSWSFSSATGVSRAPALPAAPYLLGIASSAFKFPYYAIISPSQPWGPRLVLASPPASQRGDIVTARLGFGHSAAVRLVQHPSSVGPLPHR